jgi:hypothetical protein
VLAIDRAQLQHSICEVEGRRRRRVRFALQHGDFMVACNNDSNGIFHHNPDIGDFNNQAVAVMHAETVHNRQAANAES